MKQSNPNYLQITRLDYKNRVNERGGCAFLTPLSSFSELEDINEVRSICFGNFYNLEEFEAAKAMFPKSYKAEMIQGYDHKENGEVDFGSKFMQIYFVFNTFWLDKTTGNVNEAAAKRREKVIAKIKSLMNR